MIKFLFTENRIIYREKEDCFFERDLHLNKMYNILYDGYNASTDTDIEDKTSLSPIDTNKYKRS